MRLIFGMLQATTLKTYALVNLKTGGELLASWGDEIRSAGNRTQQSGPVCLDSLPITCANQLPANDSADQRVFCRTVRKINQHRKQGHRS
ncbi:MAG TPA: hypothetical protein VMG59_05275 [Phycisphaerae bacterium]|nr:hypothetical protein [Phycisphaerae bacterium]